MLDGLQFHADGSITEEGRDIPAEHWLVPSSVMSVPWYWNFMHDCYESVMGAGRGYDPFNHVGNYVSMTVFGLEAEYDVFAEKVAAGEISTRRSVVDLGKLTTEQEAHEIAMRSIQESPL